MPVSPAHARPAVPAVVNLLANLPRRLTAEQFDTIFQADGVRIERIVSTGQTTPADAWYDQPQTEWVLLLSGAAALVFDGDAEPRSLRPGDHLLIPPHCRHRVSWTHPEEPTVWLAVHVESPPPAAA